ncbi:hypothetical protein ACLOJK_003290 [Asimina triloba]
MDILLSYPLLVFCTSLSYQEAAAELEHKTYFPCFIASDHPPLSVLCFFKDASFQAVLLLAFLSFVVALAGACMPQPTVASAVVGVDLGQAGGYPLVAWISLGGVVLCLTGTEAIFADLGHFSAMISASFSFVKQSMALAYFPSVRIVHTSNKNEGQIYFPNIYLLLCPACIFVTAFFTATTIMGIAYGIAVVEVLLFQHGGFLSLAFSAGMPVMVKKLPSGAEDILGGIKKSVVMAGSLTLERWAMARIKHRSR